MQRRDVLKWGSLLGVGSLFGRIPQAESRPRPPFIIGPAYEQDPFTLEGRERKILIVGGGLAGMSAALELAEKGYQVHLKEAGPELGGRLATRTYDTQAGTFKVEHGLHMWFHNYHNFKDVRERLGINRFFKPHNETHFTFKEYEDEVLTSDPPVYPLNLIKLLERSPNFNLFSAFNQLGLLGDVVYYNHWDVYDRLDQITFEEWSKNRVSKQFYDIMLQPAAGVTLNNPSRISAAEMVMYMHYYFLGDPKAMWREVTTVDHATAVLDPWETRLRELGVEISFNHRCQGLRFERDRIVGEVGDETQYDGVILACSIPGVQQIMSQSENDAPETLLGERFDALCNRLVELEIAPPYKVLRLWLDRPTQEGRPDILETPQHAPVNLVALFHLLEDESKQWAQETQGSILEFHLYANEKWATATDEEVLADVRPVLDELYPELKEAQIIDYVLGSYHDFTSFEVGQGMIRPKSDTPKLEYQIKGLALAGDWVKTDYPCALMERAVSTGREAANAMLVADRVRQVPIKATNRRGPGLL